MCFKSERIPLLLEDVEERRDGSKSGGPRSDDALGFDIDQLVGGELFAVHRVLSMLGDISLNETLLEDIACGGIRGCACVKAGLGGHTALGRDDRHLRGLSRDYHEKNG